jgi:hypothetical protein
MDERKEIDEALDRLEAIDKWAFEYAIDMPEHLKPPDLRNNYRCVLDGHEVEFTVIPLEETGLLQPSEKPKKKHTTHTRTPISLKLPQWLIVWMSEQEKGRSVLIEESLTMYHNLKAPEEVETRKKC